MKKRLFLLCVLLLSFFQLSMKEAEGAEFCYPVGIGFSKQVVKREPDPSINVPAKTRYLASGNSSRRRRLPQTGELHSQEFQVMGLFCLCICFWGFLFLQLREEEEDE